MFVLRAFFLNLNPARISKNGINIIWTSIKNTHFSKVTGAQLKNQACYAHFNFELQMGMADTIFQLHSSNFEKVCIFYRCSNDITIIFLYSLPKIRNLKKCDFYLQFWAILCRKWPKTCLRWPEFEFSKSAQLLKMLKCY